MCEAFDKAEARGKEIGKEIGEKRGNAEKLINIIEYIISNNNMTLEAALKFIGSTKEDYNAAKNTLELYRKEEV